MVGNRKLAAILAADIVGFSRLAAADEDRTLARLRALRSDLVDPTLSIHRGRVVKRTGDGVLAEFRSVVDAVRCALEMQTELSERNAGVESNRRIEFRIGIHLGDVVEEDDGDLMGDGVNVAARLEGVCEPGGICLSEDAYRQVRDRLQETFVDLGEKSLKNIARPVRAFGVGFGPSGSRPGAAGAPKPSGTRLLPGKPSIAVLPFATVGQDDDRGWFSDGVAEDVVTALAKSRKLFVVSRNTSFAYKGSTLPPHEIARRLGVRFLAEGSVRFAGERVRLSCQLTEVATGGIVWAERFDRRLDDIFAIQDEITDAIVAQLNVELLPEERDAVVAARTGDIEAYNFYLRGRQLSREWTNRYLVEARRMFGRAVELDPAFAPAQASIVICECYLYESRATNLTPAELLAMADRTLALDPRSAETHAARGFALHRCARSAEALADFELALSLDPDSYEAAFLFALTCWVSGQREKAVTLFARAARLRPDDYTSPAIALGLLEPDDPEGSRWARTCLERAEHAAILQPENPAPLHRGAVALVHLGRPDEARAWIGRALALDPADHFARYNAACVHAMLGEAEEAVALLEEWKRDSAEDAGGFIANDRDLDAIRSHPRYPELVG